MVTGKVCAELPVDISSRLIRRRPPVGVRKSCRLAEPLCLTAFGTSPFRGGFVPTVTAASDPTALVAATGPQLVEGEADDVHGTGVALRTILFPPASRSWSIW